MSKCLWCRGGDPQGPGAHHAADCPQYRSATMGPDAERWAARLREMLMRRNDPGNIEAQALEEETLP